MAALRNPDRSATAAEGKTAPSAAQTPVSAARSGSTQRGGYQLRLKAIVFHLTRAAEIILLYLCDTMAFFSAPKRSSSVLVVKPDEIGDFILWLDSAKELKRLYADRQLILVANRAWVDLSITFNYWDSVVPIEQRRFIRHPLYRLRLLARIRRFGAQIAIHPVFSRNFLTGDAILRVCGAKERIGFRGDSTNMTSFQKRLSDRWYSLLVATPPACHSEIKRHAELTRALGAKAFVPQVPRLAPLRLCRSILDIPTTPYYLVFPGSYRRKKQWPPEHFAALVVRIHQSFNLTAVICGGIKDHALALDIIARSQVRAMDLTGRTSLPQLTEVIRRSLFIVGNDTGAIHLAAALGKPSICILGGAHIGRFLPYDEDLAGPQTSLPRCIYIPMACNGCNWKCRYISSESQVAPCVGRITVQQALGKIQDTPGIQRFRR